jgi:hypothetical protein
MWLTAAAQYPLTVKSCAAHSYPCTLVDPGCILRLLCCDVSIKGCKILSDTPPHQQDVSQFTGAERGPVIVLQCVYADTAYVNRK